MIDREKVKQLRARYENARDEYMMAEARAGEAQKIKNAAYVKYMELEEELKVIVSQ